MSYILLKCIKEKNKLRIKFFSFTDEEGKTYTNIYNQNYNCRFPKDIRKEGFYYKINGNDLTLSNNNGKPFYNINFSNIKILNEIDFNIDELKIYKVDECIICFENTPTQIFLTCGHQCTCNDCCEELKNQNKFNFKCPICRRDIFNVITQ